MIAGTQKDRQAQPGLGILARLGAAMADPFAFLHEDHLPLLAGSPSVLGSLAAHPSFSQAVRRAMPHLAPLATVSLEERAIDPQRNRLLLVVLTLASERLAAFTRDLAALSLHPRLQRVLPVADRQALQQALGGAAWDLARQEASLAYRAFAGLDLPLAATADLSRMERCDFERLGGAVLLALVALESRTGLELATLRFSSEAAALARKFTVTGRQLALACRLAERRGYAP